MVDTVIFEAFLIDPDESDESDESDEPLMCEYEDSPATEIVDGHNLCSYHASRHVSDSRRD